MYEIFGTGDQEGTPLPYYVDTQSHRAKGGGTWQWWTRTLMGSNSCVKVNADGDGYSSVVVDNTEGVAPFGCL